MNVKRIQGGRLVYFAVAACLASAVQYFSLGALLVTLGGFLATSDDPTPVEAVVVLSTGVEYYPRTDGCRQHRPLFAYWMVERGTANSLGPGRVWCLALFFGKEGWSQISSTRRLARNGLGIAEKRHLE